MRNGSMAEMQKLSEFIWTYIETAENKVSCPSVLFNKLLLYDENFIAWKL